MKGHKMEKSVNESPAVEVYRRGLISIGRLAEVLGMGVIEADRWLAQRHVPLNYTQEDLETGRRTLDRLMSESSRSS